MNTGLLSGLKANLVVPRYTGVADAKDGTLVAADVSKPGGVALTGQFPKHMVSAYQVNAQAIAINTWTWVHFDTVISDPSGVFVPSNGGCYFPVLGSYLIIGAVGLNSVSTTGANMYLALYVNNAFERYLSGALYTLGATVLPAHSFSAMVSSIPTEGGAGEGSYFSIAIFCDQAVTTTAGNAWTYLDMIRIQ